MWCVYVCGWVGVACVCVCGWGHVCVCVGVWCVDVCAHNYLWGVFVCVNSVCVHIVVARVVAVVLEWFMD